MSFLQSDSLRIFKVKDFRLFIMVRLFLTLAIQMQFSTIYLQIYYEYSKDELNLGLIGLAEAIPFIATSFFSGHFVDLIRKKRIILTCTFLLLLGAIFLYLNAEPFFHLLRSMGMTALFSVVFLFGIIRAFIGAATNPFLSQLIPRKDYTTSATWNSSAWHTGAILGPVLAGLIYGHNNTLNAQWCHLIEVLLFTLSFILILRINNSGAPELRDQKESILDSIKVGIRFVFKTKMVLSAISLDLFAVLFGGAVVLIPAFTSARRLREAAALANAASRCCAVNCGGVPMG